MKYLKIFKNWRIIVLTIMFVVATLLLFGDCSSIKAFALNIIGLAIGIYTYRLADGWHKQGLIDEINVFNDNDE